MIKNNLDFMIELDKFFDEYERNSKKFKLLIEFNDIEVDYEGNSLNMENINIKLKPKEKKKINIVRNKNINKSKNSLF